LEPGSGSGAPGAQAAPASVAAGPRQFDSFSALRNALLDLFSRATERVWLTTDYLTDGELVSALYIARYRKLDVKVLLARGRANGYMSRLNYLKNQNVPVFLRPDAFRTGKPTALLTDDALFYVDAELDFLSKKRAFVVTPASPADTKTFAEAFAAAAGRQIPAVPQPVPLVGRAGHQGAPARDRLPAVHNVYQPGVGASEGVYTYGGGRAAKPAGVPDKLPRETILQRKGGAK
jgi:hypothetical protein